MWRTKSAGPGTPSITIDTNFDSVFIEKTVFTLISNVKSQQNVIGSVTRPTDSFKGLGKSTT